MVVAFTGYRPEKMPFQESKKDERYLTFRAILSHVISRLIELGGTYFISGVARGFDTWVAEEILQMQKENIKISLECVIPFPGQADSWEKADQKRKYNTARLSVMSMMRLVISRRLFTLIILP